MSSYPVITTAHYQNMIRDFDILDNDFDIEQAIRIFISVTKNMDDRMKGVLSGKDMSRMMLYEAIVRIAFFKYKSKGVTETTFEAVKKLIGHLKATVPNFEWMPWRKEKLWTLEVDDLYKANL